MIKVSGIWLRKSQAGKSFMTGKIGDASILIFKNERKKNPNEPDYELYIADSKPKPQEKQAQAAQAPIKNYAKQNTQVSEPSFGSDDDVPF